MFFHERSPRPIQNPNESVATLTNHRACAQECTVVFCKQNESNQTASKHMCFSIESGAGTHGAQARAR